MMFLALNLTSISLLAAAAIISFGLGLLIKNGVIAKQRKRILQLEDEMLANHAKILSLEKKITEGPGGNESGKKADYDRKTDHGGLRAS